MMKFFIRAALRFSAPDDACGGSELGDVGGSVSKEPESVPPGVSEFSAATSADGQQESDRAEPESVPPDVSEFSASTNAAAPNEGGEPDDDGDPGASPGRFHYNWRVLLPWLLPIAAAPIAYLIGLLFSLFPNSVELVYSRFLYQFDVIQSLIAGLLPFSLGEILLPLGAVALATWFLFSLIRARAYPARFVACALGILSIVSVCGARFTMAWGLNYQRATVAQILQLDVHDRPVAELEKLVFTLAREANLCRGLLPQDRFGVFDPGDDSAILAAASDSCTAFGRRFSPFNRPFPKAKPLLFSQTFSYLGISGIYNPFTSEANLNVDEPKLLRAAAACHELSHMAGFAREDEANFLAFYATRYSKELYVRYSGTILALLHASNELYDRDPAAYESIRELYSDAVNRDLADHAAYWSAKKGPAQEKMDEVNDTYLKAQGEEAGVESYGRMVDLLLAFYAKQDR